MKWDYVVHMDKLPIGIALKLLEIASNRGIDIMVKDHHIYKLHKEVSQNEDK